MCHVACAHVQLPPFHRALRDVSEPFSIRESGSSSAVGAPCVEFGGVRGVRTAFLTPPVPTALSGPLPHCVSPASQAFHELPLSQRKDPAVLRAFLEEHFHPPGSDLVPHVPHDHTDSPRLLGALLITFAVAFIRTSSAFHSTLR